MEAPDKKRFDGADDDETEMLDEARNERAPEDEVMETSPEPDTAAPVFRMRDELDDHEAGATSDRSPPPRAFRLSCPASDIKVTFAAISVRPPPVRS